MGRPHVVVGCGGRKRASQIWTSSCVRDVPGRVHGLFDVVHTMEEAYAMVEVRPKDFTERLSPREMAPEPVNCDES